MTLSSELQANADAVALVTPFGLPVLAYIAAGTRSTAAGVVVVNCHSNSCASYGFNQLKLTDNATSVGLTVLPSGAPLVFFVQRQSASAGAHSTLSAIACTDAACTNGGSAAAVLDNGDDIEIGTGAVTAWVGRDGLPVARWGGGRGFSRPFWLPPNCCASH